MGEFSADLLVEDAVIVELKSVKAIAPEHQAQIINDLNATGIDVGLLINFGNPKLEYKRFYRRTPRPEKKSLNKDAQDRQDEEALSSIPFLLVNSAFFCRLHGPLGPIWRRRV